MGNFLDKTGLTILWGKITGKINSKATDTLNAAKQDAADKDTALENRITNKLNDYATVEFVNNHISTAVTYKGNVETYDNLPSNPSNGDMYNVNIDGKNYVWNNTTKEWDLLSGTMDIDFPVDSVNGKTGDITLTGADIKFTDNTNHTYTVEVGLNALLNYFELGGTGVVKKANADALGNTIHMYYATVDDLDEYLPKPPNTPSSDMPDYDNDKILVYKDGTVKHPYYATNEITSNNETNAGKLPTNKAITTWVNNNYVAKPTDTVTTGDVDSILTYNHGTNTNSYAFTIHDSTVALVAGTDKEIPTTKRMVDWANNTYVVATSQADETTLSKIINNEGKAALFSKSGENTSSVQALGNEVTIRAGDLSYYITKDGISTSSNSQYLNTSMALTDTEINEICV